MIKIISYADTSAGIKEYVVDTRAELQDIKDCEMGSSVFVIEDSSVHMMGGNGEWREI